MLTLLIQMILKELRTTVRERHQMVALAAGVLAMSISLGFAGYGISQEFRHKNHNHAAQPTFVAPPPMVNAVRWVTIGIGAGAGLLFALGYLISATLATFVGEKESRTLEILLVSPVSDNQLYALKCLSVILPMTAVGYVFVVAAVIVAYAILHPVLMTLGVNVALYALVFSTPLTLMVVMIMVGLGAAISAKADTTKGAGQVFGAAFVTIFFGFGYGVPLLIELAGWGPWFQRELTQWLLMPFALQYAVVLGVLAIPAGVSMAVGRALFQRNRLIG